MGRKKKAMITEAVVAPVIELTPADATERPEAVLALDQSSAVVGHSVFVNGVFESSGQFEPDPPYYIGLRTAIKDYVWRLQLEGYRVAVVYEDIFSRNVAVFKKLAVLIGHVQSAAVDAGARLYVMNSNKAFTALTGRVPSSKNPVPRVEKKAATIAAASAEVGYTMQEDEADAYAIGKGFLAGFSTEIL